MNIKCGTDIIEVKRIEDAIIKSNNKFLNEVFTDEEIEYCNSRGISKYQHYAARFAAKEAIFKAASCMLEKKSDLTWKDAKILNKPDGKPYVILNKNKIKQDIDIDISLSHIKEYAIANCIIIFK